MAVDLKTIWRDDEFAAKPLATAVALPPPVRAAEIGRAPAVIERPATIDVQPGMFSIQNTGSEYWDLSKEDKRQFMLALSLGGFEYAQKQFPNVTQEPYTPRGNIAGAVRAFIAGMGRPSKLLPPEVKDVSPFVEIPAHLAGEVVKYAGIGKIMKPLAELAPAATGLAAGGIRQVGKEEPSLEDPLLEMLLVGGGVELAKGVAQQLRTGAKTLDLVKPVAKKPAKTTKPITTEDIENNYIRFISDRELAHLRQTGKLPVSGEGDINLVSPKALDEAVKIGAREPSKKHFVLIDKNAVEPMIARPGDKGRLYTVVRGEISENQIISIAENVGTVKDYPALLAATRRVAKPAKEPWEMTKDEFFPLPDESSAVVSKEGRIYTAQTHGEALVKLEKAGGTLPEYPRMGYKLKGRFYEDKEGFGDFRKQVIQQVLKEGKPVPAEVLKDYPELAKKVPIAPKPAKVAETPEAVAKEFGIKYNGPQERLKGPPVHLFTDSKTGGTFAVEKLKDVPNKLELTRSEFAKAQAPLTDLTPGEASVTLGTFGYTPEVMKSVQKTWAGAVDKTVKKAVELMPPKVRDVVQTVSRGHLPAEVKQVIKDREKGIILGRRHAKELGESISKNIPEEYQFEVYKTLDPTHIGDLGEFPKSLQPWVQAARNKIDEMGLEAVSLGLLKPEVYYRNVGEYLGRYYKPHQEFKKFWANAFRNWFRRGVKGHRFIPRILKTTAARKEAGLITDPAYAVSNTIRDLTYDIETAKVFRRLAQNPEWVSSAEPTIAKETWKWVPGHTEAMKRKYGDLAGKWIRKDIFDEVNVITETRSDMQRVYDRLLGMWKFGKTALNPATHGRNIFSNVILADFGGLSPLRVDVYAKAAREYIKKGRFYQEALEDGLLGSDWFGAEVKSLTSGILKPGQKRSMFDLTWDMAGRIPGAKLVKKAGDIYQGEEHFFKLALYMHQRAAGATRTQATAHAHKYLFDYNDLAPALRRLRRAPWGGPFLSFTAKALPIVAETAVKRPFKVGKYYLMFRAMDEYGKAMIGMDDTEYAKMKASLPSWRRSGWQVLLPWRSPVTKEEEEAGIKGNPILWDLTYNLPWGDIAEQGTFIPVPVLGAVVERFFGGNPFARVPIEILANKDFFRDHQLFTRDLDIGIPGKFAGIPIPTAAGGQATEAIVRHAARQFAPGVAIAAPPVAETLMGKPRPSGEVRDPLVEILNRLMGIKFVSIDVERGKRIKVGILMKLRNELISRVYKLKADRSLSAEDFGKELDKLREANEGLIEKAQKLNIPFEPAKVPADTSKMKVDLRTIWR